MYRLLILLFPMRVENFIVMMEQIPPVLGPTPKETTDDENERLGREKMILDALQVESAGEVTMEYCIICYQDYKVAELIAWSSNSTCRDKFHRRCILRWLMSNETCPCCRIPLIHWHKLGVN
jgi:hypothetical protein